MRLWRVLYSVMFYAGLSAALIGAALVILGTVASRMKKMPLEPALLLQSKINTHVRRNTTVVVALAVLIIFALFSYWPGVYNTSINERVISYQEWWRVPTFQCS